MGNGGLHVLVVLMVRWEVKTVSMNHETNLQEALEQGWEPIGGIPVGTQGFFKWLFRRELEPPRFRPIVPGETEELVGGAGAPRR